MGALCAAIPGEGGQNHRRNRALLTPIAHPLTGYEGIPMVRRLWRRESMSRKAGSDLAPAC